MKRALIALTLVCGAAHAKDKVVVLPLSTEPALETLAKAAGEQIATDLNKEGRFEVLGESDLQALLGIERQKQLMGCAGDSGECTTELTGAIGAPYLLSGTVARTADGLRVDLKLLQTEKSTVVAREGGIAKTDAELLPTVSRVLQDMLLQLPGVKTQRAKQKLPWVTGSGGALLAVAGLIIMAVEGVQTGNLQGQLAMHSLSATQAQSSRGSIYLERGLAVTFVTVGSLAAIGSLIWWWLQ